MRQLQKKIKTGTLNLNQDDPFELFIAATSIRYCYYNETHKILGNTFGMCVLQVSVPSLAEVYLLCKNPHHRNHKLFYLHKFHVSGMHYLTLRAFVVNHTGFRSSHS